MDITPTTIILVGVVCVILGFLASVLLNTLRDEVEGPGGDDAPPGGRKGHYTPIARLWQERGSGGLVVEMDGKTLVSPGSLDSKQRQQLEHAARDLRAWFGMSLSDDDIPYQAASDPRADLSDIDLSRAIGASTASNYAAGNISTATPQRPAPKSTAAPAVRPVSSAPTSRAPNSPKPASTPLDADKEEVIPPANKSIVMQIEDILQEQIAGTELARLGVHLLEDPLRGVIVQVGLHNYEGMDSVPDPVVKQAIQTAVQTWEKTQ